ncbi:MAG TPA: HYR domain-containing protein, partial [Candidatus Binatia bacterium]|nr:HYR domain-containing protein [Candidatus Binatia bacterium]
MKTSIKLLGALGGLLLASMNVALAQGTITRVPTLGGAEVDVRALANSGALAGFSRTTNNEQHAFLYQGGVMTDLMTLGGPNSVGSAVNNLGHVVGDSGTAEFGQHAFRFRDGAMLDLGVLEGDSFSMSVALNDAGDVAGQGDSRGFFYRNGVMNDMGSLGSGFSFVSTLFPSMNATGDVVGTSFTESFDTRAFLYHDGAMTNLGTLPGGTFSRAWALNDAGDVVGEADNSDGERRAFLYRGGQMLALGTLGGNESIAYSINNAGQVMGDSLFEGNMQYHAFLFTGGAMVDLGTPPDCVSSGANAMNNLGHVVGEATTTTGTSVAFLWRNGSMVDLNTLLPEDSEWYLSTALYINDADQVVGYGTLEGEFAWYLFSVGSVNHPPLANAGADLTGECGSLVRLDGSASSDPDNDPLTFEWREGNVLLGTGAVLDVSLSLGLHSLTLTVTDSHSAAAYDFVDVVVRDTTPPSVSCPNARTVSVGLNCSAEVPDFATSAVALDACSSALVRFQSPEAGTPVGLGSHVITVTVTDPSGNSATCTTTLNVVDMTPPTGDCPPPMTVSAGANCLGVVPDFTALLTAEDNCTPAAQLVKVQTPVAGSKVGLGPQKVTLVVSDASGNQSMCVTTLNVVDTTPPTVTVSPVTANAGEDGKAALPNFVLSAEVSDNCGGHSLVQTPVPGTMFGLGTYTVTLVARDTAGNTTVKTTTFTVVDRTAPVITAVSVNPNVLT